MSDKNKDVKTGCLPGLNEAETRYFHWGLCTNFDSLTRQAWENLIALNLKMLKAKNSCD